MRRLTSVRRALLASVVLVVLGLVANCGDALAVTPWWHVNTVSAPAGAPGLENRLVVEVSNLGDTEVHGAEEPVTILDRLPAGVSVTNLYSGGGGSELGRELEKSSSHYHVDCAPAVSTVTCTYAGPLLPYERLMVVLVVNVSPGAGSGVNEVSVAGGQAAPVTFRRALQLDRDPSAFEMENYELTPEEEGGAPTTQAGSHPFQLTSTLGFASRTVPTGGGNKINPHYSLTEVAPSAQTKDLRFKLPPGLVGNPTPLPHCSTATFVGSTLNHGECPIEAQIGVATVITTNLNAEAQMPRVESTPLFNLEPSIGEPAKFGFRTPAGAVTLDTSVRTGEGYGVVVSVHNIIQNVVFIGSQVTFWGDPSDPRHDNSRGYNCLSERELISGFVLPERSCPGQEHGQPLIVLPTSCTGPLQGSVEGDSWQQPGVFVSRSYASQYGTGEPYGQDGCNRLNFEPSISVAPDGQQASTPTGLTVNVHVPQEASLNPVGLAEATVRDTTVTLPAGVGLNPAGADGLSACGLEEIGLESPAEQSCPESAKVATVEIHTPLLPNPLVGAAYLAQQDANPFGSLVALYLVARDPVSGVLVKLAGEVTPDPATGQLVSTFKDTPQLPFEDLSLHFFGGSRAPLGTPALCGGYTTSASLAPWSGNAPVQSSSEFQITSGPDGTPCRAPLPFDPSLTGGSLNLQAGAFTPFTTTMSREDGNQNLDAIQLHMPPGLSGLLAGVELCGEAQADAGACGPRSLIGETIVSVGLGGNPYTVKGGKVYITGPYKGAPFGLSIVNPAKAGPFDLGQVIVRAKIEVDPTTAALTVTSDPTGPYAIPQIFRGIPLQIKHVDVTINRPGFTFNPTNCEPSKVTGSLTSSQGALSSLSIPFQVTNCATLAFKPTFKAQTSAKATRANGTSLRVAITYPSAPQGTQANIKSVKVDLPKQLPSRLTTLQKACTSKVFEANPSACPTASRVGIAKALTPILPVALEGPAYFVSYGDLKFPELILVLQGYGLTIDLHGETFISKKGITSSTFRTVPDQPVGSFELTLPAGPSSALAANGNLCKVKGGLKMPTTLTAQNGSVIKQSTPISVTGCPKAKRAHGAAKHGKKSSHPKKR